jgi:hypothetical protein
MKIVFSFLLFLSLAANSAFAITTLPADKETVSQLKQKFIKIEGKMYFVSGDQLFDPEMIEKEDPLMPPLRAASFGKLLKWEDGVIPFRFAKEIPEWLQYEVLEACKVWAQFGNIKCQVGEYKKRSLLVTGKYAGCWSTMGMGGMVGGIVKRRMNLQLDLCTERWVILHELGHALGMIHEHQRTDRDEYVEIDKKNVDGAFVVTFNFKTLASELHTPYDFYSIMHYGYNFFSNKGETTIQPKPQYERYKYIMGGVKKISPLDQYAIGEMYGHTERTPEITEAIAKTY